MKINSIFIIIGLIYSVTVKVFHVAPFSGMMQNEMAQVSAHDQIVWRTLEDEGDTEIFFKVDHIVSLKDF